MGIIQAVIGVIILVFCIWIGVNEWVISGLRSQLQTAHDQTSACTTANVTLKSSVDTQNTAIKQLEDAAQKRADDAAKAEQNADAANFADVTKAQGVLHMQTTGTDDCKSAQQVLQTYLKGRLK